MDLAGIDPASLNEAVRAVVTDVMLNPASLSTWLGGLAIAEQTVGLNTLRRMQGENPEPAVAVPADDKRFADPAWKSNPFLFGALEEYFVRSRAALQLVDQARLPEATRHKARFAMRLMLDALAPSNVPWMNPAVVKEAMNTGGASLVRGLQTFLDDVKNNGGQPRQVDTSGFTLGKNLAATPGRVIFRNDLIELIAYEPQTKKVHAVPLLCSPPWINKYYIMDLAPNRSFVEFAVRAGHQTFMISYRNPDETMAGYTMDDYLRKGVLTALDVVERTTGSKKTNLMGLCLGGTLVVIALAYLAAKGQAARV
ncbi:MAG: poly-beta-hydroxybutyrate polymerase, partial [Candidatus Eremiobacteraeota bacterium]|nr:poly-beta-hydroxybutyrate polymerase [Candidatus Eremiobacteraeota bacterium]